MLTREDIDALTPEERTAAFLDLLREHHNIEDDKLPKAKDVCHTFDISAPTWRRWRSENEVPVWAIMLVQEWVMKRGSTRLEIAAFQRLHKHFAGLAEHYAGLGDHFALIAQDLADISRLRADRPALAAHEPSDAGAADADPESAQSSEE